MLAVLWGFFRQSDLILFCSMAVLMGLGFAVLYSMGLGISGDNFFYLKHQTLAFGIGMVALLVLSTVHYQQLRTYSLAFYIATLLILIAVLFLGSTIRGTKGWLAIGGFTLQPVELAKLGLIIMLARYFSSFTRQVGQLKHIVISGSLALLPIGAVLLQPDLGSAAILFIIWLGMILMSGVPRRYTIAMCIMIALIAVLGWMFVLKDYQRQRVLTFLSPTHDVQGKSYNIRQAQIAIGSGELFGRGLGFGSQSHLRFLPESQTDFIFSVIAEELGFIGVGLLLFFWFVLLSRLVRLMRIVRDDFGVYCVLGVTLLLFSHMAINIGGNLGLIPLTGIVLPFLSYGGSALVIDLIGIGLVESIHIHSV
ncbi:MAG: rod shape-determining protein RodA [Patescibacteria group bacterium]